MLLVSRMVLAFLALTWVVLAFPCSVWASASVPAATIITAANTTKPGCQRMCGNLTIPYPFGIGVGCSMGWYYTVLCNFENGSYITRFARTSRRVLDISETQLIVTAGQAAISCYSAGVGSNADEWRGIDVAGTPYVLSSTANKFVVTGCHHYGLIEAETRAGRQVLSCVSLCTKDVDLLDGTCSGIGCCHVSIPKGLQKFTTSLEKIYYNTSISSGNCSYAFVIDYSRFNFRGAIDLQDPEFVSRVRKVPVVADWFVANETCRDAQQNSVTYACQQNTNCTDLDQILDVKGYRCECRYGYEGNPYLSPGCIDINECAGPSNPCSGICSNVAGSYKCYCPSGYQGDGRKDGTGCRPSSLKFFFVLGFGIGLGSVVFLLAGYWLLIVARRRKEMIQKAKHFKQNGGLLLQQHMSSEGMIIKTRIFSADELEKATDHFSEDRVLGQGGQGVVYKGMLTDGSIVAIKKARIAAQRQLGQFVNELVILSQLNHRNIVKLLGCCLETEVPLLVYEFVTNGALSKHIHEPSDEFPITWNMRLQIAVDIAGALVYLHSVTSRPIFHRDIKTANVLLDARYRAKLSDFGTSRSVSTNQTHLTTNVQGTFGYLDPEYFRSNKLTEKSDVYGFGVVLLELLTGRKAILPTESHNGTSLVSWFLSAIENSDLFENLDPRVVEEGKREALTAVVSLAKRCLSIDGKYRPTMEEAAAELERISQLQHGPVSLQEVNIEEYYREYE